MTAWRAWRPLGIAVAWIALFVVLGGGLALALVNGYVYAAEHATLSLPDRLSPWFLLVFATLVVIGFAVATWVVGVRLAKHSWANLGWRAPMVRALLQGFAIGALMAAIAIALSILPGGARVRFAPHWSAYLGAALPLAIGLLSAALWEELVFRGFPLRRLADALGAWPATLILAVAFALMHIPNDNATPFGILNIVLAGVWLSIAFFSPGGMALGWGLHVGWNLGLALVGMPVSGMRVGPPQVAYYPGPHPWFDGGAFGPEGGLIGTIAIAAGVAAILRSRVRHIRAWVAA